jgi:glycine oxidase
MRNRNRNRRRNKYTGLMGRTTDVLIVGQGLAGCMLALELHKREMDFLVMAPTGARPASLVAAGLYFPLMSRKPAIDKVFRTCYPVMGNAYREAEAFLGTSLLHEIPSIKLFPPAELEQWRAFQHGPEGSVIQAIADHAVIPGIKPGWSMAVIRPSGYVDLPLLVQACREWLIRENRFINWHLDHSGVRFSGNLVKVNLSGGDFVKARHLVFCEGASGASSPWFGQMGIKPNKGELIDIAVDGLPEKSIMRCSLNLLPLGKGKFRAGATYCNDPVNDIPSRKGLDELTGRLREFVNLPFRIIAHRAGLRPASRNRKPVTGSHPRFPNLSVLNGLGSKGVLQAPYHAWILADQLASGKVPLIKGLLKKQDKDVTLRLPG